MAVVIFLSFPIEFRLPHPLPRLQLHRLDLTQSKMPNPPPGPILHRQGSIIWDPYMPDLKPEDEVGWLWNPLEQELKAVAADFLNPLSAELRCLAERKRNARYYPSGTEPACFSLSLFGHLGMPTLGR
jgi:hypothetical protein